MLYYFHGQVNLSLDRSEKPIFVNGLMLVDWEYCKNEHDQVIGYTFCPWTKGVSHRPTISTGFRLWWHSDCPWSLFLLFLFKVIHHFQAHLSLTLILNANRKKILNNNSYHLIPHLSSFHFMYCTTELVAVYRYNRQLSLKKCSKILSRSPPPSNPAGACAICVFPAWPRSALHVGRLNVCRYVQLRSFGWTFWPIIYFVYVFMEIANDISSHVPGVSNADDSCKT